MVIINFIFKNREIKVRNPGSAADRIGKPRETQQEANRNGKILLSPPALQSSSDAPCGTVTLSEGTQQRSEQSVLTQKTIAHSLYLCLSPSKYGTI